MNRRETQLIRELKEAKEALFILRKRVNDQSTILDRLDKAVKQRNDVIDSKIEEIVFLKKRIRECFGETGFIKCLLDPNNPYPIDTKNYGMRLKIRQQDDIPVGT